MPCRPILLSTILFALAWLPEARAAGLDVSVAGSALDMASPCARHVEIRPDPGLQGRIGVHATAGHEEEIDQLLVETRDVARIRSRLRECWRPTGDTRFSPTLDLVVSVPAGFALSIDEAGAARYAIGAVGGPLALDLSGAVQLDDERATTLHAGLGGTDAVRIGRLDGSASVVSSGDTTLTLAEATIPTLHVGLSGTGTVTVARGCIDAATLAVSGTGTIRIGAATTLADVDLSGVGSVRFDSAPGQLRKAVSGLGSVSVGP